MTAARSPALFPSVITSIEELRHLRAPGLTADAVDRSLQESYKTTLY